MEHPLSDALSAGAESVMVWADVLDRINVYPVPDGDTGRNMVITLGPLRQRGRPAEELTESLMLSARGNSGNIAAGFLSGLLRFDTLDSLPACCAAGRDAAYRAVKDPQEGTMLSLLDTLVTSLNAYPPGKDPRWTEKIVRAMEAAVISTKDQLHQLRQAGVVDAGALGMHIFLDACLPTLAGESVPQGPSTGNLQKYLDLSLPGTGMPGQGYCMDVVLGMKNGAGFNMDELSGLGESLVAIPSGDFLKVHLHVQDQALARKKLEELGHVISWEADDLGEQTRRFMEEREAQVLHIMTDAAGSISRRDAEKLGITLLDSYVTAGNLCLPETYIDPAKLFASMRDGAKASTSQASLFERHRCYHKVKDLHRKALYMCVGSFYTGNHQAAMDWKTENDPEDVMVLLDTGIASGKLGLSVMATARYTRSAADPEAVIAFARWAVGNCHELLFLERLHYLATGGRMSKTGAFFGDTLRIKPVVTPEPDGAKKAGVVRKQEEQLPFALKRMDAVLSRQDKALIMVEYTDNLDRITREILPRLEERFPGAEILLQPLSLTSAVHMGPGTWGVAFLPLRDPETADRVSPC